MTRKSICAAASALAFAGLCVANGSDSAFHVQFEVGEIPNVLTCDAPDTCVPFDWTEILIPGDCTYISGQLEKREAPHCEPDTFLVCFDKLNDIIESDDNGSNTGNGWASGIQGSDCFIDNGDGTRSLRLGVTGRPDGLDGVFNGLFQNGPHGQLGSFTVSVDFRMNGVGTVAFFRYSDEFITGAEAFYINYEVPADADEVVININNVIASAEDRCDVDFMKLTNLVPLCDYCIEQIGGLNCECRPTDTALGWFDKNCTQILNVGDGGAVPEYAKLCVVADANGEINLGVSGEHDRNFNGLDDSLEDAWFDAQEERALIECPDPKPGHGEAGCYTLKVYVIGVHEGSENQDGGDAGALEQLENAMSHGDLNMDGRTDTADLGVLIGNFGWAGN